MKLKFMRDVAGIYGTTYRKDSIHYHTPFDHEWQGMDRNERERKGIYVECHGQGEFVVFKKKDILVIKDPA